MPNYKLIGGNTVDGRARTAKLMFAFAGQEFEDVKQTQEEWLKLKPDTPYGERPLLEVDGVMIAQSRAIERLLAKRFDLYGSTDMEQAYTDMVIDCIIDFETKICDVFLADTDEKKAEVRKKLVEEKCPVSLKYIEKMIKPQGYFLGDKISWADIALLGSMQYPAMVGIDNISAVLDQVPKVKNLLDNVRKENKIAEWISKHAVPKFQM